MATCCSSVVAGLQVSVSLIIVHAGPHSPPFRAPLNKGLVPSYEVFTHICSLSHSSSLAHDSTFHHFNDLECLIGQQCRQMNKAGNEVINHIRAKQNYGRRTHYSNQTWWWESEQCCSRLCEREKEGSKGRREISAPKNFYHNQSKCQKAQIGKLYSQILKYFPQLVSNSIECRLYRGW